MESYKDLDVVIVGGSYAGLSAAMALGRSLRSVLIIDSGKPCNRQTPHSHNFLTQDGATPKEISDKAKAQVLKYPTVKFLDDIVISVTKTPEGFNIFTPTIQKIKARKILFTTGVKDIMPNLKGFSDCWGISVLHCPYCHGFEVANKNLGIIANGEIAFDLCTLIQHWTDKLTLFTNGKLDMSDEQVNLIRKLKIGVVEKEMEELIHDNGYVKSIKFKDGTKAEVEAIFSRVPIKQHCEIPVEMGCKTTETGHLEVDFLQKTNIEGIYCAGDNTTPFRAVSFAISSGTKAGVFINMELLQEKLSK